MERSRRTRAPKRGAAALAQLQSLRGGDEGDDASAAPRRRRQLDTYEVKEEAAVYDVVDEDEYADIVAKRRREGGELGGERAARAKKTNLSGERWAVVCVVCLRAPAMAAPRVLGRTLGCVWGRDGGGNC